MLASEALGLRHDYLLVDFDDDHDDSWIGRQAFAKVFPENCPLDPANIRNSAQIYDTKK